MKKNQNIYATAFVELIAPFVICQVLLATLMIEKGIIKSAEEFTALSNEEKQKFKEENTEILSERIKDYVNGYNEQIKKEKDELLRNRKSNKRRKECLLEESRI